MKALPSNSEKGPSGPAKLTVSGKKLTAVMLDQNGLETRQQYVFDVNDAPGLNGKVAPGKYFIGLSLDTTKIYNLRPLTGMFVCEFVKFASGGQNQPPMPKHVTGTRANERGSYEVDEQTFLGIAKVIEGPMAGLEIAMPFLYSRPNGTGFSEDEEGNLALRGTGKRAQMLSSFLEATGAWDHIFPFSENVLPALEAYLQKSGKPFIIILSKGWPDAYSEAGGFASKKAPAKKVAAKKAATKKK